MDFTLTKTSSPVEQSPSRSPSPPSLSPPPLPSPSSAPSASHKATRVHVWLPSDDPRPPPRPELREEDFVPTAAEAHQAFSGQVKQRERLTDAPLLTKALKDREQTQKRIEKYARFPLTRIRIRFSDRTMLEGTFSSDCTISDVYLFATACLAPQFSAHEFVLYQAPPRREFVPSDPKVKNISLLDLQLSPSSLLYIKFVQDALNATSCQLALLPTLLRQAEILPPPPTFDNSQSTDSCTHPAPGGWKVADALKPGAKTPKWLQKMKKK